MNKILEKIFNEYKKRGVIKTSYKILCYPYYFIRGLIISRYYIINLDKLSNEDKFNYVYRNNYWGVAESKSGSGSTISYTHNLRFKLPELIKEYEINSILDAPCGDFNWMSLVIDSLQNQVNYIGGDIVKVLIENNQLKFSKKNINFIKLDITKDYLPKSDLMICRDCLFHFSYEDINKFMINFIKSEIKFLLTSTHKNTDNFRNRDILTGDFRKIDLFLPPFSFPQNVLWRADDWILPWPEREVCIWSKDQLKTIVAGLNNV